MNKRNNLAVFTLLLIGLISSFTVNLSAQNKVSAGNNQPSKQCSGEKFIMPSSIALGNEAFENYLKTALPSRDERRNAFRNLSKEQKASFIKVNLALQLVKQPNMTKEQRQFVSDAISKVSADIYDSSDAEKARLHEQNAREIENKALGLFAYKELGDFIEPLMMSKVEETALVQKYESLLKSGTRLRRSLVKQMPIAEQINIWKTQMAYHLAASSFNKEQKEFIVEFMSKVQSVFDASATLSGDERTRYVDALEASMFKVFTKAEAYAVFMTIGIQNRVADSSAQFLTGGNCDCRWNCDLDGYYCGNSACSITYDGCGPLGYWNCTNLCYQGSPQ